MQGVPEPAHRLLLDLSDALARHPVDLANFIERFALAIDEAEAHFYHACLALTERVEHIMQLLLQKRELHLVYRIEVRVGKIQEVRQGGFPLSADRRIERQDVVWSQPQTLQHLGISQLTGERKLVHVRRLAVHGQASTGCPYFSDALHHVNWQTDQADDASTETSARVKPMEAIT